MDTKAVIAFVISVLIVSPLIYTMFSVGSAGGDYINNNNFRKLLPDVTDDYTFAASISSEVNAIVKYVLVFSALLVAALTIVEYVKFFKIYKEH